MRPETRVRQYMCFQLVRSVKLFGASYMGLKRTLKLLDSLMGELMTVQLISSVKGSLTEVASKWFLASMNNAMHLQIGCCLELFITKGANVLNCCMRVQVSPQVTLTHEYLVAFGAREVVG